MKLLTVIKIAQANNLPFFILGGGSNILFSDLGFSGLVLKIKNNFIDLQPDNKTIIVGAGTPLASLVKFAYRNSLCGLEWAAGIPGTLGGAVRGNAGAFNHSIGERLLWVRALYFSDNNIETKIYSQADCQFAYRDSVFKRNKNLIITSAAINLAQSDSRQIESQTNEYLAKKLLLNH